MKNTKRLIGTILIGVLILISGNQLFAQDWPQWRGMNRDGKVTGFIAPETWPAELTKNWAVTVGFGDSTPALQGRPETHRA